MPAQLLDGKTVAKLENEKTRQRIEDLCTRGITPGLATVLVGQDPASHTYVASKRKTCKKLGIASYDYDLPAETSQAALLELLARLNGDFRVHGILVQLPLPKHLDERRIVAAVDPAKDVDGFHPENIGLLSLGRPRFVPCTTLGILCLLEQAGLDVTGLEAMVAGRSNIVGKPTAMALTACHATVTVCHTRTRDLEAVVRRSALIVAAIGRPEAIRGDWIAPGAIVIDVGTNRVDERLVGDVQFAPAAERAAWITPVPGGVGPMTIAMLMRNTVSAATGERG